MRDWIHVDDHNRGVDFIIKKGKIGETYCLGGNQEQTNLEITKLILKLMSYGKEKIDHVADRLGHDLRYSIDFAKAKNELGWEPQINFRVGLASTIKWYENNQEWWKKNKK